MIYVSTGGYHDRHAGDICRDFLAEGVRHIELSGGLFAPSSLADLATLLPQVQFQVHNYFPPPQKPFVLNLASLDPVIAARSIEHVEQALDWCVALGATRYSFHAGFLLDPRVDELGRRIRAQHLFDRDSSCNSFVERVTMLAIKARERNIQLMIENNVLGARNSSMFTDNPLLMCDPDECHAILSMLPIDVGFLVDVAHLRVSANSLGFNPEAMFDRCSGRITGYHLSDNDGIEDTNESITSKSWFWPYLKRDVGYYSIEVYGVPIDHLVQQVTLTQQLLLQASD